MLKVNQFFPKLMPMLLNLMLIAWMKLFQVFTTDGYPQSTKLNQKSQMNFWDKWKTQFMLFAPPKVSQMLKLRVLEMEVQTGSSRSFKETQLCKMPLIKDQVQKTELPLLIHEKIYGFQNYLSKLSLAFYIFIIITICNI